MSYIAINRYEFSGIFFNLRIWFWIKERELYNKLLMVTQNQYFKQFSHNAIVESHFTEIVMDVIICIEKFKMNLALYPLESRSWGSSKGAVMFNYILGPHVCSRLFTNLFSPPPLIFINFPFILLIVSGLSALFPAEKTEQLAYFP